MADLLDEALVEPTPSGLRPDDVYATLPAPPTLPTPTPSAAPDPAAFESRSVGIGSGYESGKKRPAGVQGSIAGGLILMIAAALWSFGGQAIGVRFRFAPVLFIIGLVTFVVGLFRALIRALTPKQ
jgi:hypothetical protein